MNSWGLHETRLACCDKRFRQGNRSVTGREGSAGGRIPHHKLPCSMIGTHEPFPVPNNVLAKGDVIGSCGMVI